MSLRHGHPQCVHATGLELGRARDASDSARGVSARDLMLTRRRVGIDGSVAHPWMPRVALRHPSVLPWSSGCAACGHETRSPARRGASRRTASRSVTASGCFTRPVAAGLPRRRRECAARPEMETARAAFADGSPSKESAAGGRRTARCAPRGRAPMCCFASQQRKQRTAGTPRVPRPRTLVAAYRLPATMPPQSTSEWAVSRSLASARRGPRIRRPANGPRTAPRPLCAA